MLVIGLCVGAVIEVVTDVLINMLTAVAVGVGISVLVGAIVVVVTSTLIAFELAVPLSYLVGAKSGDWAEAVVDIDASIGKWVGEYNDAPARV